MRRMVSRNRKRDDYSESFRRYREQKLAKFRNLENKSPKSEVKFTETKTKSPEIKQNFYEKLEQQLNSDEDSAKITKKAEEKPTETKVESPKPAVITAESKPITKEINSKISNEVNRKITTEKRKYTYKEPEKYKCDVCNKGFGTKQAMEWHKFAKHKGVKV